MRDRWRKRIKYELLDLATDKTKLEGKAAQEKISKRYHQLSKRMKQTDHDELLEMYLTALTTAYDPHTTYMSKSSLENFEIQMRLNLEGHRRRAGSARRRDGGQEDHSRRGGGQRRPAEAGRPHRRRRPGRQTGRSSTVADMKLNDVVKLIRGHQGTTVRLEVVAQGRDRAEDLQHRAPADRADRQRSPQRDLRSRPQARRQRRTRSA